MRLLSRALAESRIFRDIEKIRLNIFYRFDVTASVCKSGIDDSDMHDMGSASCCSLCVLSSFVLLFGSSEGARILAFFPHPIASRQHVIRPVIEALAARGHAITYVSGFPWKSEQPNVQHRVVSLDVTKGLKNKVYDYTMEPLREGYLSMFNSLLFGKSMQLNEAAMFISQKLVQDPVVKNLIYNPNEKYDLVMTEAFSGYEPFAVLSHRFNATSVVLLASGESAWANELSGLPNNPAYMVDSMSPHSGGPRMPRISKLYNWLALQSARFYGYKHLVQSQAFVDEFFRYPSWESRAPLSKLVCDHALILVNNHHAIGHSYPRALHMKEVGGVSIQQPHALPAKILHFVENADDGVIFFSPGKSLDFSSPYRMAEMDIFLEVLSKRRERVIWKWRGDLLKQKPDNIMFLRDLPESDILSHNKTKLFITQGGLLDMMAAVHFAVPVVGIISTEEGKNNLRIAREAGYALDLNFSDLTIDTLNATISEVIDNQSFQEKVTERSAVFLDRLLKPQHEAVYWIEYVLRHGNILQPASVQMAFEEVNLLDIYVLAGLLLISVFLTVFMGAAAIAISISWAIQRRNIALMAFVNDSKDKTQ